MAYINFKEERAVAKQQLERRKKNNNQSCSYILKHKADLVEYTPDSKYSYMNLNDKNIGKKGVLDDIDFYEISNIDIVCAKFIRCNFMNVKFKDCRFVGCTFDSCKFSAGGGVFENCILIKEDTEKSPSLNKKDNLSCTFYNCDMYVKFLNSDLSFTIFENCKIKDTAFEQSNMKSVIFVNSELNMITVEDCDFSGLKTLNCYISDLDFDDKFKTKFDEKTFFDTITERVKDRQEYEGIYMTYQTLADKFKENTLNNNFGEYYFLCKKIENKTLKIIPRLESYLYWITCGYGERPEYALFTAIGIIILFAIVYLFTGVELEGTDIHYTLSNMSQLSFSKIIKDLNETLNLSVGMFAGVGVNEGKPSEISYMVSNLEMIIGIIMMGVGIGTLTRKIVR